MRLGNATVLAFMKQKGEASCRLIQRWGLAGSQGLGAQSLYLTAKAPRWPCPRDLPARQSSQHGLCRVLGEGNLAPHTQEQPLQAHRVLTAQQTYLGLTALLLWFKASFSLAICAISTCTYDGAADPFSMLPHVNRKRPIMHLQRTVSNSLSLKPAKARDQELPATL